MAMDAKTISIIEKKLGYSFRDKQYLVRAFTHSSASKDATKNYESLEFLGDSILDFVVADRIMKENPNAHEGALTTRRSEIVSQEPLEKALDKLGVANYLIVGKGEKREHIITRTKVKSNLFEAIVGAIYLDSGSVKLCDAFILAALHDRFDGSAKHGSEFDYKTELNEFASKNRLVVQYELVDQSGEPHCPTFVVDVLIDGVPCGRGRGGSKKAAQQDAASVALSHIYGN